MKKRRVECIQTMVVLRGGQTMNYILNINFQKSVNLAPAGKNLKIRGAKTMSWKLKKLRCFISDVHIKDAVSYTHLDVYKRQSS